jgi:hypothetical protein
VSTLSRVILRKKTSEKHKKNIAILFVFGYSLRMEIPSYLLTSQVENLSFEFIQERLKNGLAIWMVVFDYQGKSFWGYLEACPEYPTYEHEDTIEQVQAND